MRQAYEAQSRSRHEIDYRKFICAFCQYMIWPLYYAIASRKPLPGVPNKQYSNINEILQSALELRTYD
jgi:hypothetical protein